MSLSQKEKVNLQRLSKKGLLPTGLYLYHPASKRWIPAQCDDEGRLVIDPADLDSRYYLQSVVDSIQANLEAEDLTFLKLDGSRVMTGHLSINLAAGTYDRIHGSLVGVRFHKTINRIYPYVVATDNMADIQCFRNIGDYMRINVAMETYVDTEIRTSGSVKVAVLDSTSDMLDLFLAGGGNLPVADPADGKNKLWNNAGVVNVGT